MSLRYAVSSELATVLVVRKKDDRNKKASHLILEMSVRKAFIWLSGHRFTEFSLKLIPHGGTDKI